MFPFSWGTVGTMLCSGSLRKKSKELWLLAVGLLLPAFAIAMIDTMMGGFFSRYYMDFSYILTLSSVCVLLGLCRVKRFHTKVIREPGIWVLILLLVFEILFCIFSLIVNEGYDLRNSRQDLYYHYMYLFGFGL